jgi:tripartite-type tricarboxylate transporter receptor subunit TctC
VKDVLLSFLSAAALFGISLTSAQADEAYPSKPIQMVVGYAAGGPTDVTARILAQEMSKSMGQPVIVVNKTGAASLIGTKDVLNASPDGYTVLFASLGHSVNPILLGASAGYDPVADFAPIALVATQPLIVVTAYASPVTSLQDLLKQAKTKPEVVSFGSAGNGGSAHLAAALLGISANVELLHVPFRGNAPALAEVMAGRVSFMFYPSIGVADFAAQKRLKVLAVSPSAGLRQFPGVPTMADSGFPGFEEVAPWVGLLAPAKTSPTIIKRLNEEILKALAKPEVRKRLQDHGNNIVGGSPSEFSIYLKQTEHVMKNIVKSAGIKAE